MVNLEDIKKSILKVLKNDSRTMPQQVLMHKVFKDLRNNSKDEKVGFISQKDFMLAIDDLIRLCIVGKNQFNKYFIDYPDYEEKDVFGEGYLEIDESSGNGYITMKKNIKEYKKSSHFVHKKNIGSAKSGDYVRFVELKITDKKKFSKFALIDAKVKEILPPPKQDN